MVGWGVRTLEFIGKGKFIFEYVGEHIESRTMDARVARWRETDVYLMEIGGRHTQRVGGHAIDALHARNVSAYANFACFPNMRKKPVLGRHWDSRLPSAAFVATRDIAAGEELTYRRDEAATSSSRASASRVRCACGHVECRKWV
jgi:histone-lysine N-methyltransferase SETMAR